MNVRDGLQKAIELKGLQPLAKSLDVTYQAIRKWQKLNQMPRTEWTGETRYSQTIESITNGAVKQSDLLKRCAA